MKIVLDTHTHTIACNHAYSTIEDNAKAAKDKGLELICITEHGPSMPGGPHKYFFANIKVVPPILHGVKVLKGIEANILDFNGKIDLPSKYENRMEIVLAGLHNMVLSPGSKMENTKAVIKTMENPLVDIIVHPGNPAYELEYTDIVQAAKDTNTFLELNNSSFVHSRKGSYPNCHYLAQLCMDQGVVVSLGSDAHFAADVGAFSKVDLMIEELNFPEKLIVNTSIEKLLNHLRSKGRELLKDPRDKLNYKEH
ncbi:MAG TPA: phosphatase [Eubacteriaceae bacterium]|nr:phosphatase [Eubacteriaceae bacterium]